ncbi:MAG: carboxypeptidase-like regulatory domain-containing protein [Bacteroidota bacterium]
MKRLLNILVFFFAMSGMVMAQAKAPKKIPLKDSLVQFSGIVVERDSLKPVSFTKIMILNSRRGTTSDFYGYFSFVAKVNDTIEFSAVGYKKVVFVIPDSLTTNRYSLIQLMSYDTIMLKESVIYPWPSKEQFEKNFLTASIPDDDTEKAKKNLEKEEMKLQYETMPMDGSMNFKASMQQQYSKLYYAGQYPPNNLLNPIAWAKFIQAWKNGDFKPRDKDENSGQ